MFFFVCVFYTKCHDLSSADLSITLITLGFMPDAQRAATCETSLSLLLLVPSPTLSLIKTHDYSACYVLIICNTYELSTIMIEVKELRSKEIKPFTSAPPASKRQDLDPGRQPGSDATLLTAPFCHLPASSGRLT